MSSTALSAHLQINQYGNFRLTEAVRPGLNGGITPREGYRISRYQERGLNLPVLVAAVSSENLFEIFLDLLSPLSAEVDVVLETSHNASGGKQKDLFREGIDLPILQSYFCEHENLLLNDGCLGLAVVDRENHVEVQFDEHKVFFVYADNVKPFEQILRGHGLKRDDTLPLIMEAEHLHITHPRFQEETTQLCYHLGISESMAICG